MSEESEQSEVLYQFVVTGLCQKEPDEEARAVIILTQMFRMLGIPLIRVELLIALRDEYRKRSRNASCSLANTLQAIIEGEHAALCMDDPDIPF